MYVPPAERADTLILLFRLYPYMYSVQRTEGSGGVGNNVSQHPHTCRFGKYIS
jgi:hypothetical protein